MCPSPTGGLRQRTPGAGVRHGLTGAGGGGGGADSLSPSSFKLEFMTDSRITVLVCL